jgi:arylsulfatase A-like enzyme
VHSPYEAPDEYMERCGVTSSSSADDYTISDAQTYCAMNVMLDEALANLTCVLSELGMNKNSVLVISSDNGGDHLIAGNSYPYHGQKGSCARGGVSSTAMIISDLLPESARGSEYAGTMHVTGKRARLSCNFHSLASPNLLIV